jgi:hypothetical protein
MKQQQEGQFTTNIQTIMTISTTIKDQEILPIIIIIRMLHLTQHQEPPPLALTDQILITTDQVLIIIVTL